MICSHHFVLYAEGPATAFPLVLDSPPGRRSKRTRWFTGEARGVALSTATSWTDGSFPDIALLAWHRERLIQELADLRRRHRAVFSVMSELHLVTSAILAMGAR